MSDEKPRYPLVIFDMDGVLTDHISSWMFVHNHFGVDNEDGYEDYRQGRIDDLEFMRRDIGLWRQKKPGITCEDVRSILNGVPLMPGANEVFQLLKQEGVKTAIISGGLEQLAERLRTELGIDLIRSNGLETDGNGALTGEGILRVPLRSKEAVTREVASVAGVPLERTAAIGDTMIDATMLRMCALGIAFDPKDASTSGSADVVIHDKDLREILKYIL
ncbi:MAG: HAD-IB family phosphatase [Thermoplasmata archaeon]|nr:HAD-IB family phosphatase [Thermoplasmata archaeon]